MHSSMNIYDDKILILADGLRRAGLDVTVERRLPIRRLDRLRGFRDLWIGYWTHTPPESLPSRYIAVQTEPMMVPDGWWTTRPDLLTMLRGSLDVWDYHDSNRPEIEGLGAPFRHVPCGYSPLQEEWFRDAVAEVGAPDIDVLFVGGVTPRRAEMLDRLQRSGLHVETVDYYSPVTGADLRRLIARSRLVLGIHRYEDPKGHILDLFRFDFMLANGIPMLHERLVAPSPFDRDFLDRIPFYDPPDIVDAVRSVLEDHDAAVDTARSTREWFRQQYPIDRFLPIDRLRSLT